MKNARGTEIGPSALAKAQRRREKRERPADETVVKTLGQLNAMLTPEAQGWKLLRNVRGGSYYYFVHPHYQPSAGIYVYSCKGTTLGFWRRELATVLADLA